MCGGAEMGANLPAVDLGSGRSAVAVDAGDDHTCALLVRCEGRGLLTDDAAEGQR